MTDPIEYQQHGALRLAIFAPSRLGIVIALTTDPLKSIPMRGAQALARDPSTLLVANGPMFDNCSGQSLPSGNASYAQSRCSILRGVHLDVARGVRSLGLSPTGMLISVLPDGTAVGTNCVSGRCSTNGRPCASPSNAIVSIQLCPALLWEGNVLASPLVDSDTVQRAGLFIMQDGRLALAMMAGSMWAFAIACHNAGCVTGGYTDGGGSTRWALRDGTWHGASEDRPVGSWIVVNGDGGAGGGSGMGVWGWALAAAAVVGGAIWALRRPSKRR